MKSAGFRAATAVLMGGLVAASTSIAVAGESPGYDDNYNRSVIALDLDDGKQVWRINPSRGRWLNGSVAGHGLGLISEFTCGQGTFDGPRTWAVDLDTGDERWSAPQGTTVGGPAGKGILFGLSGGRTSGIDVNSGEVVWNLPKGAYIAASSKRSFFTTGTIDEQGPVDAGTLHAFDRATAKEQWSVDVAGDHAAFSQLTVVRADTRSVVVQYSDPGQILLGRSPTAPQTVSFITLDAKTGAERARIHIDTPPGAELPAFVATDDLLIYPDNNQVIARDLATGDVRWTHPLDVNQSEPLMGTPDMFRYLHVLVSSGADHTVFARTGNGGRSLVVHALDTTTGDERWSARASWMLASTGHTTLLGVDNEQVMDVDTRTGRTRWTAVIPGGGTFELVAYVSDRRVIVSSACPE